MIRNKAPPKPGPLPGRGGYVGDIAAFEDADLAMTRGQVGGGAPSRVRGADINLLSMAVIPTPMVEP